MRGLDDKGISMDLEEKIRVEIARLKAFGPTTGRILQLQIEGKLEVLEWILREAGLEP